MPPPQLSDQQRRAALDKAAEARSVRAVVKVLLKTGSLWLDDVFVRAETDELVAGTKTYAILVSMPGVGKVKAKRIMEDHGIAESRRIRGLGTRQRAVLLELFP